jgi:signal transduction histidine kinase
MRERLEMVGGHFDVNSTPGKGTTITAKILLGDGRIDRKSPVSSLPKTTA